MAIRSSRVEESNSCSTSERISTAMERHVALRCLICKLVMVGYSDLYWCPADGPRRADCWSTTRDGAGASMSSMGDPFSQGQLGIGNWCVE